MLLVLAVVGPGAAAAPGLAEDARPAAATTPAGARAAAEAGAVDFSACPASSEVAFLVSPRTPRAGEPLRVVASSWDAVDAPLIVQRAGSSGAAATAATGERRGAMPYWWAATVDTAVPGTYRIGLGRGREVAGCAVVVVVAHEPEPRPDEGGAVWPIEREWSRASEGLYSAWIEQLFTDPLDAEPSWQGIGAVLADPERNLLHDHLGLGEESGGRMRLEPDCADLPFFLRAYFAWKLGLPFGFHACSRGSATTPPRCEGWRTMRTAGRGSASGGELDAFLRFARRDVGWGVHSGSARTPLDAEASDLYPTRIAPGAIRPGTVYADPYGHTLVVVARHPQTAETGGLLLAVDAQPDGTVARKRFWRGNFLFAVEPELGGAGFKNFRPIVEHGGRLRLLDNEAIAADAEWGDFSLEQRAAGVEGFYDRMDELLSPEPRDPRRAFQEMIDALDEQVGARVRSVANGEEYVASHPGVIAMPEGAAIFETTGAWEDYATPARDLRLLIAIDVVRDFDERVARSPERYRGASGGDLASLRGELAALLDDEAARRRFSYRRSDGSEWQLTLAEVIDRSRALEMAYNPNDCIELRWGAPAASEEAATCRRRAPGAQRQRMERYREWFRERRRPPRG